MNNNGNCERCGAARRGRFCNICGAEQAVLLPEYAALLVPKRNGGKIALIIFCIAAGIMLFIGGCTAIVISVDRAALRAPAEEYLPDGDNPYSDFYGDANGDFNFGYTNRSSSLLVEALQSKRIAEADEALGTAGKSYFVVTLRLTNIGDAVFAYDAANFEVCSATGNLSSAVVTELDKGSALGSGRLLPSGIIEGTVVFKIKTNEPSPILYIEDDAGEVIFFPLV